MDGDLDTSGAGAVERRLPVGAELQPGGGVHFRVWAPAARRVAVVLADGLVQPLASEAAGYFSGLVAELAAGARYRFCLDGDERTYPDPASRFQPDGPHGSSEVVDPGIFAWTDAAWKGVPHDRLVIYELHVGTFTPEGTWEAAAAELAGLAEFGVTCIEMMPVADFSGRFGWGYDGVDLFAPTRLYGSPDDLRRFVDRAHACGIAVILDVVYNHLGPDGNYLNAFAPAYFTDRHDNEWGAALNFDGPDSGPVREFFVANAGYWIDEYHIDGLRLDATQQIFDQSPDHILAAIGRRVREAAKRRRSTFVSAESESQEARLVRSPEQGGFGLDAIWNDDFHHAARVALTGRREAYCSDYRGGVSELLALAKHGFLFQGQRSGWQQKARGSLALDVPAGRFVIYLQNHDQVANSAQGLRLHQLASPGAWRAVTAFSLLLPAIPLLFQGQEFAASGPFVFFADHPGELGRLVREGRRQFVAQFRSAATAEMQPLIPDPGDPETFRRCILDHRERETHAAAYALHRDLLALRRTDPVFTGAARLDGAVLGERSLAIRYFAEDGDDRLLLLNLGPDEAWETVAEPLLAPAEAGGWQLLWSSEAPQYGGGGTPEPLDDGVWRLPGQSTLVLRPKPR